MEITIVTNLCKQNEKADARKNFYTDIFRKGLFKVNKIPRKKSYLKEQNCKRKISRFIYIVPAIGKSHLPFISKRHIAQ